MTSNKTKNNFKPTELLLWKETKHLASVKKSYQLFVEGNRVMQISEFVGFWEILWQKFNKIFIIMFSFMFNHLKINKIT